MNSDPEFELDQADAALWKKTRSGETGRRHVCSGVAGNPPEDCGGIGGYYRLLEIMADQKHPGHAEMEEWIGRELDAAVYAKA